MVYSRPLIPAAPKHTVEYVQVQSGFSISVLSETESTFLNRLELYRTWITDFNERFANIIMQDAGVR